jgi:O-antigen ligase
MSEGLLRREFLLAVATALTAVVVTLPVLRINPYLALALVIAAIATVLACRSVIYPVALAGVPSLFIGFWGSNPFPGRAVFLGLTVWLLIGIGYAFAVGLWPQGAGKLAFAPLALTATIAVLLMVRIQIGSYPTAKVELFLLQDVPLLVAGILIASRRVVFRRYLLLVLTMALANAALLVEKISSGNATKVFTGRFTIDVDFNPIAAGRVAASGILIAVALVLSSQPGRRLYGLACVPFLAVALLSSGSRGPVLALLLAFVALVALTLKDRSVRSRLLFVAAGFSAGVAFAPALVPSTALSRATGFLTGDTAALSSNGRTHLWSRAIDIFSAHPLAGVGTGGFATYEPVFRYPHNIVLESAAELGVVGGAAVVVLLAAALRTAVRNWSDARAESDVVDAALAAALLVAAVVNALLSDAIESTDTLWLAIGLVYGLRVRGRVVEPEVGRA